MLLSSCKNFQKAPRQTGLVLLIILFLIIVVPTTSAQNSQSHGNSSSATLHINIYVVPTMYAKAINVPDSTVKTDVAYHIPLGLKQTALISETKPIEIVTSDGVVKAYLKTTTVVLQ